ncbi:hypothetical protein VVF04_28135 [Pseudomonas aeruginosa]|uniref:DUF6911 family protein n=1 Tax=Pseudomonas aeruginosa TaxID=287 RepID=UPI001114BE1D|nr:hypothetical protein [Pseudomonas aeruginosa]EKU2246373.1 hypothetical protein [Pseudomonas aeruginosa]ELS4622360.1 hypothetical protein [Pseudomonas aeruginosa]MBO7950216.1 hypothetical protein [Pseudomonas aeruginosa]MBO8040381.1 hypothetical protein [Pseudomonas aeruginosa]MCV3778555.1 hypothetical protein [Pseudomonas aeruginosa]
MIVLGGYLIAPEAKRTQFPVVSDPDEEEVLAALSKLRHSSGVLVLRVKPEPEIGAYEVALHAESGRFMVMLSQHAEDGEHEVFTLRGAGEGNGFTYILGEAYPMAAVTENFGLICNCFKKFLLEREVSSDVWV